VFSKKEEKPTTPKMKYARRDPVGTPKLGSPIKVTTVGLGNLEVVTHNGNTNI
tara:strand:- start:2281 stop:2439 length:159 start_codon:yes stop_codon:yes gene_type:complete